MLSASVALTWAAFMMLIRCAEWRGGGFITTKFQIDAMLERLMALSDDHFDTHPDEISWGYIGALNHYASLLRQITESAFNECEHAA